MANAFGPSRGGGASRDRRRRWELESLLETVLVDGMVTTSRSKLPTLLGRERERGEVWQEICELYDEIGGDSNELRGKRVGSQFLLTRFDLDQNPYAGDVFEPRARI
jgi:hypothetical protein